MQTTTSNAAVFVPTREDIVDYIWDVYKEVNGIRPRWMDFDSMSYEELDTYAKELAARAEEEYKQRQLEQAADLRDFEERVEAIIAYGAGDRATAGKPGDPRVHRLATPDGCDLPVADGLDHPSNLDRADPSAPP